MKRKLENVSSVRGAPMGRANWIPEDITTVGKFHLVRMRMVDGAYDEGGAYWGCGSPDTGYMYWAYAETEKERVNVYVRAKHRPQAKAQVRAVIGWCVNFYR